MIFRHLLVAILLLAPSVSLAEKLQPPEVKHTYLSVFTHTNFEDFPQEKRLVEQLNSSVFDQVRETTHFRHYKITDPLVASQRFGQIRESDLPILSFQLQSGGVVYYATKENIPDNTADIYKQMHTHFDVAKELQARQSVTVEKEEDFDQVVEGLLDRFRKPREEESGGRRILQKRKTPLRDIVVYGFWGIVATCILVVLIAGGFFTVLVGAALFLIAQRFSRK